MSLNFHYSSPRIQIPFSVIPSLPISEQFRIINSVLQNFTNFDTIKQKEFSKRMSEVKENNFLDLLNSFEAIGENLWKYHTLCFMYNPKKVNFAQSNHFNPWR